MVPNAMKVNNAMKLVMDARIFQLKHVEILPKDAQITNYAMMMQYAKTTV